MDRIEGILAMAKFTHRAFQLLCVGMVCLISKSSSAEGNVTPRQGGRPPRQVSSVPWRHSYRFVFQESTIQNLNIFRHGRMIPITFSCIGTFAVRSAPLVFRTPSFLDQAKQLCAGL